MSQPARVRRFSNVLMALTLSFHLPLGVVIASFWPFAGGLALAIAVSLLGTFLLRGRFALMTDDRTISSVRRFAERLYFAHWGGLFGATVLYVPASVIGLATGAAQADIALGCSVAGLVTSLYATYVRAPSLRIRSLEIALPHWPRAFDGYRVAHLSDIHLGSLFTESDLRRVVERTNALAVDAIALTGDYVTSGSRFQRLVGQVFSELRAKDGVFAVMGNHDNAEFGRPIREAFVEAGLHLLENTRAEITRGGEAITIAGVDDIFSRRNDVRATFAGIARDRPGITLVHDPAQSVAISEFTDGLILAGHTHWGQIAVPFFEERLNFATRVFRFSAGRYAVGSATLYVHPGIGTTGPPLRFGVRPEITVLTLRSPTDP